MTDRLTLQNTQDGSLTFFSEVFQEAFHSYFGAKQEAIHKFVIPSQILEKSRSRSRIRILDICYGLGYNSAAALQVLEDADCYLEIQGLEQNPEVPRQAIAQGTMNIWSPSVQQILATVAEKGNISQRNRSVTLLIGDARQRIQEIPLGWADAIFLDPFSPPRCPQLWTVEFLQALGQRLQPDGYLLTYSCAAAVRKALTLAGLTVGSTPPIGRRAPGTIAAFPPTPVPPLTIAEAEQLWTKAAVPYRETSLGADSAEAILDRRRKEQKSCSWEPTSQWRRRHSESAIDNIAAIEEGKNLEEQ